MREKKQIEKGGIDFNSARGGEERRGRGGEKEEKEEREENDAGSNHVLGNEKTFVLHTREQCSAK